MPIPCFIGCGLCGEGGGRGQPSSTSRSGGPEACARFGSVGRRDCGGLGRGSRRPVLHRSHYNNSGLRTMICPRPRRHARCQMPPARTTHDHATHQVIKLSLCAAQSIPHSLSLPARMPHKEKPSYYRALMHAFVCQRHATLTTSCDYLPCRRPSLCPCHDRPHCAHPSCLCRAPCRRLQPHRG